MNSYNNEINKLGLYSRQSKESTKELRNYEKRCKKIIQVENEFRCEMLEYLYTIAYPPVAGRGGSFEVPALTKEKAKNMQKKNPRVEKAVAKLYTIPIKKVEGCDPKKLDVIARIK